MKKLYLVATLTCALQLLLHAGPVRVSFLNNSEALQGTLNVLTNNGCSDQAVGIFSECVLHYYATSFEFNFSKFPRSQAGFYSFKTIQEFIAALPHRLPETQHAFDLNCFDMMIILANDKIKTALHPDDNFGPFLSSYTTTNGQGIAFAATARDAFNIVDPDWYRETTKPFFPDSVQAARICLTAELFRWHILPASTREQTLQAGVMSVLRTAWQREQIKFPQTFELVLCHGVHLPSLTVCTAHTGLLFHHGKGYAYIEKAGGSGPFVRLDFDERSDLLPWLSASFNENEHKVGHLFATFNDTEIKSLDAK